MLAGVLRSPNRLEIEEYPLRKLERNEILVKVHSCGICGTDFHIYHGESPSKPPVVIGHEYSGEVIETGSKEWGFSIDDRVAINPNIHCEHCEFCKKGKINLCKNLQALGVTRNGGLAEFSIVPIQQAYLLPSDFSLRTAAFSEPLSCCIHGINQASIDTGDRVLIIGGGTVGLLMLQLSKLRGASKIILIEPSSEKRNIASKLNADFVFDSLDVELISKVNEVTEGGADVVIECVGKKSAVATAFKLVRKGGTIVVFGLTDITAEISIHLQSLFHNEITIKTSLLNPFTFQTAVDLLVSQKISVEYFNPMLIPFKTIELGTLFTETRNNSIVKYMVIPNN
jgi:2-desacetyl-2-hydroxyethyl bacteriochlorophyllide A dehydrogenase